MLKKFISAFVAILIILLVMNIIGTVDVVGSSMCPTCENGDIMLISKVYNLSCGDIVSVYSEVLDTVLCKRIIGVSGDKIEITNSGLYVNGELMSEDYVSSPDWYLNSPELSITVTNDCIFVMGDNRNNSTDSREIGCMSINNVHGKVIFDITRVFKWFNKDSVYVILIVMWAVFLVFTIAERFRKPITDKGDTE